MIKQPNALERIKQGLHMFMPEPAGFRRQCAFSCYMEEVFSLKVDNIDSEVLLSLCGCCTSTSFSLLGGINNSSTITTYKNFVVDDLFR